MHLSPFFVSLSTSSVLPPFSPYTFSPLLFVWCNAGNPSLLPSVPLFGTACRGDGCCVPSFTISLFPFLPSRRPIRVSPPFEAQSIVGRSVVRNPVTDAQKQKCQRASRARLSRVARYCATMEYTKPM